MDVPEDAPAVCPVCATDYDSVSQHDAGLMVNLLDNARYRRVCFDPVSADGTASVRFYHHTHEQVGAGQARPADDAAVTSKRASDGVSDEKRQ
ncbi:hypothetical protein C2R22_06135 [Salinigranum rubrum]|uniref:DUF8145 domain-containing protein n=1 Tax=Salinigranum rubrum TaxID=755307 RepID=A0A2I8VH85_9EURY|nr:hypothetical protein [Salinigranum rubrum]AUV81296.1 hypothetical protein C2R22_06135 [Salinigranum rubrum]